MNLPARCRYLSPAEGGTSLDVDLPSLVEDLSRRDPRIRPALRAHPGIRILDPPPEEAGC